ncbi:MAG: FlaA1/EpsC-like NDP-sugar epimerase [Parvicella sp.]|jgi:FlaA1/EpsC-like NDP-sugar epimerase
MYFINIPNFISDHITFRKESLFQEDLVNNSSILSQRITAKRVLVIGGAGTIGSSFIKALLRYEPGELYVVDTNENGLTELTRDIRSSFRIKAPSTYKTYPLSFTDDIFYNILDQHGPFDIVANFAAHKHVRSEKDHHSVSALLNNNVLHAKKLLDHLSKKPPKHFFCVSTDKAANPVNVMGASKKLMEDLIMSYADKIPITTARFANVAFSNGSLLDGFIYRLMKRQPLSAPNDVKRYFVSPKESGEICLLACVLGNSSDIFFPKLAQESMITFSSIADQFLASLGLKPKECSSEEEAKAMADSLSTINEEYPVYYFESDTSGEKSFEEFYTADEELDLETYQGLGVIKNIGKKTPDEVNEVISVLTEILHNESITKQMIVDTMSSYIENFHHIETGKNLDQRM